MYPSQPVLCSPCPDICATCLNASYCLTCPSSFQPIPINGTCVCDNLANLYLDPVLTICDLCSSLINYCITCTYDSNNTLICSDCVPETYPSGSSCPLCPQYCYHCINSSVCVSCDPGYDLSNGTCICGTLCTNCSGSISNCVNCTINGSSISCLACVPGYYLLGGFACDTCPPECLDCQSYTNCTLCQPTFTLSSSQCICDETQ